MRLTRKETLRLGLLCGLSAIIAAGSVTYGRDLLKAISKRNYQFATGLDFTSYEPAIRLGGERIETVMRWESNTRASDIAKWSTGLMARMVAFHPYIGSHAVMEMETDNTNEAPTLLSLVAEGNKQINAISDAFDREVGERTLIVNPSLEEKYYQLSAWKAADIETDGMAVSYFLSKSFDATVTAHREKGNVAFEIDKPEMMSVDQYATYVHKLVETKKTYSSELPLILGFDAVDVVDDSFVKNYRDRFSKQASAVLINAAVQWDGVSSYPVLEKSLKALRKIIGTQKLYVRLPVSLYDEKNEQIKVIAEGDIRTALEVIRQYADGVIIHDAHGMHLYRGLFGEDKVPPLDDGARKIMIKEWYRHHLSN